MKIILSVIFFTFLFQGHSVFALDEWDFTWQVEKKFEQTVVKILRLNNEMKRGPKKTLLDEIYKKRDIYTRYAKSLHRHLDIRNSFKPTLDVSSRYKLTLQKYKLSCEIAALRMIIEALSGKYVTEETLMREIPHYPGPYSNGIWWDPEKEFVWSYTGAQANATGYGVYGMPLARFLDRKWYDNEYRNFHMEQWFQARDELSYALDSLEKWDHILLWADWCTTPEFDDGIVEKIDLYIVRNFKISWRNECERDASNRKLTWTTPDNIVITGLSWEHAFLLLGYVGEKNNPSHVIVWDTDTGKHYYPVHEWMRKWNLLEYRMLVVKWKYNSWNKK